MQNSAAPNLKQQRIHPMEWLRTRPGENCLIRVEAAETNGVYSFVEIVSDPGDGTPLHLHRNEDEHIMVIEGTARFALGAKIFDAEAGTLVTLPRNVPHAWGNRSNATLRIACIAYPGGVEDALRVIAKGNEADLLAIADRFGVEHHGPTPF
jgi:mannose-6-phosphate isomerase-like protein (cupin superfamily)